MEDTLRVAFCTLNQILDSLNPCFNGRYSQRTNSFVLISQLSLNPCFNGRYFQSFDLSRIFPELFQCLNPCFNGRYSQSSDYPKVTKENLQS